MPRPGRRAMLSSATLGEAQLFAYCDEALTMRDLHSESASFGNFQLYPSARILEKDGVHLVLGDRALDILIVLVERAGEVISHKDLIARVWRGLVVDPGNLRV